MILTDILKKSLENTNVSDVILTSGSRPAFKINWNIKVLDEYEEFTNKTLTKEVSSIMNDRQRTLFKENMEFDFSIELKWHSRFRVNIFSSKNGIGIVFRPIRKNLPWFEELGLPKKMFDFIKRKNGLILITWSVWSGKSTTLASLIEVINTNMSKHIITVEDPVEYVFENKKSIIEQREVWTNTHTFENGLKYALRQASDVIMVWEMRDLETFRLALRAAETGNLVLATLHTSWAARAISRIIDMFPGEEKDQIRNQLSDSLIWVVWQDLIERKDKKWRIIATELLVNNTWIANMIRKWVTHQIDSAIETWKNDGMHTMKNSLSNLREKGVIN